MRGGFPLLVPAWAGHVALLVWAGVCWWAYVHRRWTTLVVLMVGAGVAQSTLVAVFGRSDFLLWDDAAALALVVAAVRTALLRRWLTPLAGMAGITAVVAFAALRAPASGLAQGRQVLLPFGLVFAGWVLRGRINWYRVAQWTAGLGAGVAGWMLLEVVLRRPLLNPVASVTLQVGRITELREGLPSAYISDGVFGAGQWFRPGGPFLNPPTAGFFLAAAALGCLTLRSPRTRHAGLVLVGTALLLSVARAGVLIFVCVTVAYWSWRTVGRVLTLLGLAAAALLLFGTIAKQGGTGSHYAGLIGGLRDGATSVVGSGFGRFGFQADNIAESGPSESLLGLWFVWMGLPLIVAVGLIVRRLGSGLLAVRTARLQWFAVGVLTAAALSETASSLAGAGIAWLLVGRALDQSQSRATTATVISSAIHAHGTGISSSSSTGPIFP